MKAREVLVFGGVSGVGGVLLGNIVGASPGYIAPTVSGALLGFAVNEAGGQRVSRGTALGMGAAAGFIARLAWKIFVPIPDPEQIDTDAGWRQHLVTSVRRGLIGAAIGGSMGALGAQHLLVKRGYR